MKFDESKMSEEQKKTLEEINNMLIPELMTMVEIGEEELKKTIDMLMHCTDDEFEDSVPSLMGQLISLRYYNQVLDAKDIDNMKVGDLREEYEKWNKKIEKQGE